MQVVSVVHCSSGNFIWHSEHEFFPQATSPLIFSSPSSPSSFSSPVVILWHLSPSLFRLRECRSKVTTQIQIHTKTDFEKWNCKTTCVMNGIKGGPKVHKGDINGHIFKLFSSFLPLCVSWCLCVFTEWRDTFILFGVEGSFSLFTLSLSFSLSIPLSLPQLNSLLTSVSL